MDKRSPMVHFPGSSFSRSQAVKNYTLYGLSYVHFLSLLCHGITAVLSREIPTQNPVVKIKKGVRRTVCHQQATSALCSARKHGLNSNIAFCSDKSIIFYLSFPIPNFFIITNKNLPYLNNIDYIIKVFLTVQKSDHVDTGLKK